MKRRNELDALRGIFLLIMAGTHLPTALNDLANQPLGYVSAAEGFVFLSAFLVGSIYTPLMSQRGMTYVRERLWQRVRTLYRYHLLLLLFVFTVVAAIARVTGNAALHNYLSVFFRSPGWALVASPLLAYQPPLLDILPMYIVFLALSPALLRFARRRGWVAVLIGSALLWLFAQLQGGRALYEVVSKTGLPFERAAFGGFNWYAWQLAWVAGLWIGSGQYRAEGAAASSRWLHHPVTAVAAGAVCVFFLLWRHHVGGLLMQLGSGSPLLDKWRLGPLRVVNCIALGWVFNRVALPALRRLRVTVLEMLGRNSLQVFCAHIPVCVLGDGLLLGQCATPLRALEQALLVTAMLAVMLFVAWASDAGYRHSARYDSPRAISRSSSSG